MLRRGHNCDVEMTLVMAGIVSAATNQGSAEKGDVRFYQKYQSYLNVKPGIRTKLLQADRADTQGIPHSLFILLNQTLS